MATFDTTNRDEQRRTLMEELQQLLSEDRETLAAQENNLHQLEATLSEENAALLKLEADAIRVSEQQTASRLQLTAARQEEEGLRRLHADKLALLKTQVREQLDEVASQMTQMSQDYDLNIRMNNDASREVEQAMAERDLQRQTLADLQQEQQAELQALLDELDAAEQGANERIVALLDKAEKARLEREAAATRRHLAQLSLDEVNQQLGANQAEIDQRQQEVSAIEKERDAALSALRAAMLDAEATLDADKSTRQADLDRCNAETDSARSLSELSTKALDEAQTRADGLSRALQELYTQAEQQTNEVSDNMNRLVDLVVNLRKAHESVEIEAAEIEEKYVAAQSAEAIIREQLLSLQAENKDLNNAAVVAANLAADATASRKNASTDMLPSLVEMEKALLISAREAKDQAVAKAQELHLAENKVSVAMADTARLQQARKEVQHRLARSESTCLDAEKQLLAMSDQVGVLISDRNECNVQLKAARQSYDEALAESLELRDAQTKASSNLWLTELRSEDIRARLLQLDQTYNLLHNNYQRDREDLDFAFQQRLEEAKSRLELGREKHSRLQQSHTDKQHTQQEAEATLIKAQERERQLQTELESCRERENAALDERRQHINERQSANATAHDQRLQETEAAEDAFEKAFDRSQQLSSDLGRLQEGLTALHQRRPQLEAKLQAELDTAQTQAQTEIAAAAERSAAAADALRDDEEQLQLLRLNQDFARRRRAATSAGLEAANTACQRTRLQLEANSSKLGRLRAEEKEAEEARALREAEEAQRRAQQAERQAAAAARAALVAREAEEAAHAAAQAELARREEEQRKKAAIFEEEALRLAAGRHLEPERLRELIQTGELRARVNRLDELARDEARNTDFLRISDKEIETLNEQAAYYIKQAENDRQIFDSAASVLTSLQERQTRLHEQRRAMGLVLAAAEADVEASSVEQTAIEKVRAQLERRRSCPEVVDALQQADEQLAVAAEINRSKYDELAAVLTQRQQEAAELDRELQDAQNEYEESLSLAADIAAKWLTRETAAATARANLAEIERTADERQRLRERLAAEEAARIEAEAARIAAEEEAARIAAEEEAARIAAEEEAARIAAEEEAARIATEEEAARLAGEEEIKLASDAPPKDIVPPSPPEEELLADLPQYHSTAATATADEEQNLLNALDQEVNSRRSFLWRKRKH